ncbi:MAG: LysR family transcriptional regulator [Tropicimonas sp.]|uniref:LysR family transcriptional regulator n=1 Tax=Tropicimonas sp. TaxID=2067044 RepID=UPI003A87D462
MQEDVQIPNLRHLLGVAAIAERGTLSGASQAINLSQPALTQGLCRIEADLGVELFRRKSKGMSLTEPGRLFARRLGRGIAFLQRAGALAGRANLHRIVTLAQLRALVVTVEAGGFRAGAATLGLETSSISRAYRELEQNCEVQLLERTSAGLRPTVQAEKIARFAKLALAEFRQAMLDALGWQGSITGRLAIGCLPLAQTALLPEALARFAREFPNVSPQVTDGYYASLARGLKRGDLDLVVGALRHHDLPDGLLQTRLFTDRLILVARPGHPLVRQREVTRSDLAAFPWIAPRRGAPSRAYFDALHDTFGNVEGVPRPIETGVHGVMYGLLMRTDRLTIISSSQVSREIELGTLGRIAFVLPDTSREIGVTVSEDWLPAPPHSRFLELLGEAVAATIDPVGVPQAPAD